MNLLFIFIGLSIINVIFSTIKSITTIKSSPLVASLISAIYYGYYNVVLIYTVSDFPLWQKVLITALCNFVGVFIVKWIEAKRRKDRLWEVRATIPAEYTDTLHEALSLVPHNYITNIGKYTIFNIYCATQKESSAVKATLNLYHAKYFVSESKEL